MLKIFNKQKNRKEAQITRLKLSGLHCTSCSLNIDAALEDLDGVIKANTSYAKSETIVEYDESAVDLKEIIKVVTKLGYQVKTVQQ